MGHFFLNRLLQLILLQLIFESPCLPSFFDGTSIFDVFRIIYWIILNLEVEWVLASSCI